MVIASMTEISTFDAFDAAAALQRRTAELQRLEAERDEAGFARRALQPVRRALGRPTLAAQVAEVAATLRAERDRALDAGLALALPHKPQLLAELRGQQARLGDLRIAADALRDMRDAAPLLTQLAGEVRAKTDFVVKNPSLGITGLGALRGGSMAAPAALDVQSWRDIRRALEATDRLLLAAGRPQALAALRRSDAEGSVPHFNLIEAAAGKLRREQDSGWSRSILAGTTLLETLAGTVAPALAGVPAALATVEADLQRMAPHLQARQIHHLRSAEGENALALHWLADAVRAASQRLAPPAASAPAAPRRQAPRVS